jgi:hypothetical protein
MRTIFPALQFCIFLSTLIGISACGAEADYPFVPEPARSPPPSEVMREASGRLRISIASEEASDSGVRLGRVVACSATACHQAPTPALVALNNTKSGKATFVVDMAVPRQDIKRVYFEDVIGSKVVAGRLDVSMPGLLAAPFQGAEIFVVLRKAGNAFRTVYEPIRAATGWVAKKPETVVYYDPRHATELADLNFGTKVSIPAGSTDAPQIFNVYLHDVGTAFPAIDIFPKLQLAQPWTIEVTELMAPWKQPGYAGPPPIIPHTFKSRSVRPFLETGVLAKYSEKIHRTGFITFDPKDPIQSSSPSSSDAGVSTCLNALTARQREQGMTLPQGVEYIASCAESAPFVHIAIAKINDPRRWLYVRSQSSSYIDNMIALNLQPITNFSTASAIAINGFTWIGDKGFFDGGRGLPNGYFATNGMHVGDNRVGGGHSKTSPGTPDGNKFVFRWNREGSFRWEEKSDMSLLDLSYLDHHVSSSSSIVKSGVCASDLEMERWSAIGTAADGRMVFVSSTSEGKTTSAELCAVFQKFGVENAMRLDGGTSTAMVVGGKVLNPLEGAAKALIGPLRDIAYAVTVR